MSKIEELLNSSIRKLGLPIKYSILSCDNLGCRISFSSIYNNKEMTQFFDSILLIDMDESMMNTYIRWVHDMLRSNREY